MSGLLRGAKSERRKKGAGRPTGQAGALDIVLLSDMTLPGDVDLRIANEVMSYSRAGYRTGLVHVDTRYSASRIAPEVQRCVRQDATLVVDPTTTVDCHLLIVHSPGAMSFLQDRLRRITPRRVVLVVDRIPDFDLAAAERRVFGLFGSVAWAPTNRWIAEILRSRGASNVTGEWRPVRQRARSIERATGRPGLGWILTASSLAADNSGSEVLAEIKASFDVFTLGGGNAAHIANGQARQLAFRHGDIAIDRFLAKVDVLAFFPPPGIANIPDAIIAASLAAGKAVVLPTYLKPHYGAGPMYCRPSEAAKRIQGLFKRLDQIRRLQTAARAAAKHSASGGAQRSLVSRLVRPAAGATTRRRNRHAPAARSTRRALLLPANGIGLGNVTRMMAIARRMSRGVDPIFVTSGSGSEIVESFGFESESLSPMRAAWSEPEAWDRWFSVELEHLIEAHRAELVVFDGNNPKDGLVRAVAPRPDCKFAWIRQGMVGHAVMPFIENGRYFDVIIEPEDIASSVDAGATSSRRHEATMVDPILLLDEHELLPRKEAAAALDLDTTKQAVLIQLGAGMNWDVTGLTAFLMEALANLQDVQVRILQWSIGIGELSLWPSARVVRGHPVSQYLRAFDFCIAAAGYNTFHELISYAVPTIFVPNMHPATDNQAGRAAYAEQAGAALHLTEERIHELPEMLRVLLSPDARSLLQTNCGALRRRNGAADAAGILQSLIEA